MSENSKAAPLHRGGPTEAKTYAPILPDPDRGINGLPTTWVLTPTQGKRPYRANWQSEPPLAREFIAGELASGAATGYGVRLGPVSGGLLAVDVDGGAAHQLLKEWGDLPPTATVTSGWHPHRYCLFFVVPSDRWEGLRSRKMQTGVREPGWDGKEKPADLEIRWDGGQQIVWGGHPSGSEYRWVRHPSEGIATAPDWLLDRLNADRPTPALSLQQIKTDIEWAREYLAAIDPRKADVYGDWLAVGMALKGVSPALKNDWIEWSKKSPAYDGKHIDDWDRPTFKADPHGLAKLGAWAKENGWRGSRGTITKLEVLHIGTSQNSKQPSVPLTALVNGLIEEGKSGAQLQEAILEIASISGRASNDIWRLYNARLDELDRQEQQPQIMAEIARLGAARDESIPIESCLPNQLAAAIYDRAALMNDSPESMFLCLLAGISSLQNPATRLRISKGFSVSPGIWVCLHGETGSMKTPIMKLMALDPLKRLASESRREHEAALSEWQRRKNLAKKNEDEFTDEPPQRHDVIATTGTYEGCLKSLRSGRGLLYAQDELTAFHEYATRNGRMGEVLSLWNGDALHKKLAGKTADDGSEIGRYLDVEATLFSVLGGIQPGVLKTFIEKGDDNGFWARFLFCHVRRTRKKFDLELDDLDDPSEDPTSLEGMLKALYQHAKTLGGTPAICRLSDAAARLFVAYVAELDDRLDNEALPAPLRGSIDKVAGYLGRVALTLQFLWACWHQNFAVPRFIEADCMAAAIAIMRFHLAQAELIYAENQAGGTQSLPWEIQKILEISQGRPINATAIKAACSYFRQKKASEIRGLLDQAVELGLGVISGAGRMAKFFPKIQTNQTNHLLTRNKLLPNQGGRSQDHGISRDSTIVVSQNNQNNQNNQPSVRPPTALPPHGEGASPRTPQPAGASHGVPPGRWVAHPCKPGRWLVDEVAGSHVRVIGEVQLLRGVMHGEWLPINEIEPLPGGGEAAEC